MNIVFAGTPQFAADHLKLLVDSQHEIKCILTQPDRGSGRGKKVIPSPVKEIGINNGIEVLQPNSLKEESIVRSLESLKPDLLLVVAYGLLIPNKVLDIAEKGSITLNGTSLTVNQVDASSFDINFIPHTKDNTTWQKMHIGEKVNIEIDILARYVDRILGSGK